MRTTKSAKPQPELHGEIEKLEEKIPKSTLKKLQKEADLREYSDWEYLDLLQGYIDYEKMENGIWKYRPLYCSDCGKRLTEEEIKDSKELLSVNPFVKDALTEKWIGENMRIDRDITKLSKRE